jgi:hypothetical protein
MSGMATERKRKKREKKGGKNAGEASWASPAETDILVAY